LRNRRTPNTSGDSGADCVFKISFGRVSGVVDAMKCPLLQTNSWVNKGIDHIRDDLEDHHSDGDQHQNAH